MLGWPPWGRARGGPPGPQGESVEVLSRMWCVASDNSELLERTMIEVQTVAAANRLCRSSEKTRGRWVLGEEVFIVKESLGISSTGDGRQRCSRRGGRGIQNLGSSGPTIMMVIVLLVLAAVCKRGVRAATTMMTTTQ